MTYDGVNVSMWPSVGNWSFACRSHYVISSGRIDWREEWTSLQIANGRQRDLADRRLSGTVLQPAGVPSQGRRWMLRHKIRTPDRNSASGPKK